MSGTDCEWTDSAERASAFRFDGSFADYGEGRKEGRDQVDAGRAVFDDDVGGLPELVLVTRGSDETAPVEAFAEDVEQENVEMEFAGAEFGFGFAAVVVGAWNEKGGDANAVRRGRAGRSGGVPRLVDGVAARAEVMDGRGSEPECDVGGREVVDV